MIDVVRIEFIMRKPSRVWCGDVDDWNSVCGFVDLVIGRDWAVAVVVAVKRNCSRRKKIIAMWVKNLLVRLVRLVGLVVMVVFCYS